MGTLFTAAFALFGWGAGVRPISDNSFLLHLKTGHWILQHGIPGSDVFSATAHGTPWVAQSWLAEVLYAGLDVAVGPHGIQLLDGTVGAVIAGATYRLVLARAGDTVRAAAVTAPVVLASGLLWSPRPLLLGLLMTTILIWIIEVPGSGLGRRPLLTVPVLMWCWVNVHGSFVLGFAYLGLHLAGRWLDGHRPWVDREGRLLGAAGLSLAACLANPYGLGLLLFPLHLVQRGEILQMVDEWQSPDARSTEGAAFIVVLAMVIAVFALARRRPSYRDVVVVLPFLTSGLWAERNIAIAPLVAAPVLAFLVARPESRPDDRERFHFAVLSLLVLGGVLWSLPVLNRPALELDGAYPIRAMQAVERDGLLGRRLLTTDKWGAYVVHAYWPRQKVFVDDRYDMYPVPLLKDYLKVMKGAPGWQQILDRYGVDVVMVEHETPLSSLLASDAGWQREYADDMSVVYVRRQILARGRPPGGTGP